MSDTNDKLQDNAADDLNSFDFLKEALPNEPKPVGGEDSIPEGIGYEDKPVEKKLESPEDKKQEEEEKPEETKATEIKDEEDENELFYDPKRDFPDTTAPAPTTYKDRVSAYEGIVHKITYLEKLGEDLKNLNSGFGAIDIPEFLENPESFATYKDITKVSEFDDVATKKAVFDLDTTIKLVKDKLNRVETAYKNETTSKEIDQDFQDTLDAAIDAIDAIELKPDEKWTNDELIENVTKAKAEFRDNADEYIDEHGVKEYNKKLDQYDKAIVEVKRFVEASVKKAAFKPGETKQEITPQQRKEFWEEFKADQSHLPMFKAPTDAPQVAFLEFVKAKDYAIDSPRAFIKAHKDYQAQITELRKKNGMADVRKTVTEIQKEAADQRKKVIITERPDAHTSKNKPIHAEFDDDIDHLLTQAFND